MGLENYWYIASVAKRNWQRPLAIKILDQPLVLFKDASGKIVALSDLCPHRNVPLSLGKIKKGNIQCCYHGWEFDGAGKCVFVPSLNDQGKIPPKSTVNSYPTKEQDGYIWVFLSQKENCSTEPFSVPHYKEKGWGYTQFDAMVENSVDNIVENFIDCPHTGYIHGGFFRTPANHNAKAKITTTNNKVTIEIDEEKKGDSIFAKILLGKEKPIHIDRFFMPSIVQVSYSFGSKVQFIGVQACTPISPFLTKVYVTVIWRFGLFTHLIKPLVGPIGRYILGQDLFILKEQGKVIAQHGQNFCSAPVDTANNIIQKLRRQASGVEKEEKIREREVSFRL